MASVTAGEDSVHFKSFTLKWTKWFKIIPSTFEVDRMVLKTIPSTSKVQQACPFYLITANFKSSNYFIQVNFSALTRVARTQLDQVILKI